MTAVTAARRCQVCDGDHKCSVGDEDLIICGRRSGPVPGFVALGPAAGDPQFSLYRRAGRTPATALAPAPADPRGTPAEMARWTARAKGYAANFDVPARSGLAALLGVPEDAFQHFPLLGCERAGSDLVYTFPEQSAQGSVVGILARQPTGEKRALPGGRRGLTVPQAWRYRPGPVLLVEGPSDTIAATAAGLAALGRPSNTGGVELLLHALTHEPPDRQVIVVGENDRKPDGSHPGLAGAVATATRLAAGLGRQVCHALPPAGAKDTRAYLGQRFAAGADWPAAGQDYLGLLTRAAVPVAPPRPPARIVTGTDVGRVTDEAAAAIGNDPSIFAQGEQLVQVLPSPDGAGPGIRPLPEPLIRETVSRWAEFVKPAGGQNHARVHVPPYVVNGLAAQGNRPGVRPLRMVAEQPVLTPDGHLLVTEGYDRGSGLLVVGSAAGVDAPASPTADQVRAAVAALHEVPADVPFARPAHRSAWAAMPLTLLARLAFPGPAPLFLVVGNTPGAGKGKLVQAACLIGTGREVPVTTLPAGEEERRKKLTAYVLAGRRAVVWDNVGHQLGGPTLEAAQTGDTWEDRVLGQSRIVTGPLLTTFFATGNNTEVSPDFARRVCPVRLEVDREDHERRRDWAHPGLTPWVREQRPRLVSAALTILRGYVAAGRPSQNLPGWGSFEGWSDLVRSAIVWAGCPDPAGGRDEFRAQADRESGLVAALLAQWPALDPNSAGVSAATIVETMSRRGPARTDLLPVWEVLEELLPRPDAARLGTLFRKYKHRPLGGRCLTSSPGSGNVQRWRVEVKDGGPPPSP